MGWMLEWHPRVQARVVTSTRTPCGWLLLQYAEGHHFLMPDISGVICWLTDSLILAQQVLYVAVSILIRLEGISCFGEGISHNNNNYKNTTGTAGCWEGKVMCKGMCAFLH